MFVSPFANVIVFVGSEMRTVRRITKGEWALYKQLRLASLLEAPEAFSTTYESAALRSDESWAAQADASAEVLMVDGGYHATGM